MVKAAAAAPEAPLRAAPWRVCEAAEQRDSVCHAATATPAILQCCWLPCLQATLNFAKDVLKGTWKPVRNDPPSEKREVWHSATFATS